MENVRNQTEYLWNQMEYVTRHVRNQTEYLRNQMEYVTRHVRNQMECFRNQMEYVRNQTDVSGKSNNASKNFSSSLPKIYRYKCTKTVENR
jgi:hypothetical protein